MNKIYLYISLLMVSCISLHGAEKNKSLVERILHSPFPFGALNTPEKQRLRAEKLVEFGIKEVVKGKIALDPWVYGIFFGAIAYNDSQRLVNTYANSFLIAGSTCMIPQRTRVVGAGLCIAGAILKVDATLRLPYVDTSHVAEMLATVREIEDEQNLEQEQQLLRSMRGSDNPGGEPI